jgi:hypothetical protein
MSSKNRSVDFDRIETFSTPLQCVNDIVQSCTDYLGTVEQEKTRRRGIKAWEKVTLAKINARREFLITYLERSFDEREKNFRSLFQLVDQAIGADDNEKLALALGAIVKLAESSPFKDLADLQTVQKRLDDPDYVWEF